VIGLFGSPFRRSCFALSLMQELGPYPERLKRMIISLPLFLFLASKEGFHHFPSDASRSAHLRAPVVAPHADFPPPPPPLTPSCQAFAAVFNGLPLSKSVNFRLVPPVSVAYPVFGGILDRNWLSFHRMRLDLDFWSTPVKKISVSRR